MSVAAPDDPEPRAGGGADTARITDNAAVLVGLTLASRVFGLVRDFCITHFFGASGVTDAFYMAYTIPNVLRRLVAEGTLTAVLQPAYQGVRRRAGDDAARTFAGGVLGLVLIALALIVGAGVVLAPAWVAAFASGFVDDADKFALTVRLTRWLFPVVIAMSLVGVSMAILNAHDRYAVPALAPVVLNLSIITFTVVGALWFADPIMGVVAGVLVGGVVQVLVQLPLLVRLRLLPPPRWPGGDPDVVDVMRRFVPGLFGLAVYQLNIIVLRQLASHLKDGSVSYYYTADRLMELAVGVFAIAIAQGSFSAMNERAAAGDVEGLKATWRFSMTLTSLIAVPAALGLAAIALPIVSVLFVHGQFDVDDARITATTTVAFAPGLVALSGSRATAQVFYALGDQRTPVIVSVVVLVSNLLLGLWLMRFGVVGLAATLSASSFLQTALLVLLLRQKLGGLGGLVVAKGAVAHGAVGIASVALAWLLCRLGVWDLGPTLRNVGVLASAIGAAIGCYGALAMALRLPGADGVTAKLRRRLGRS